ncbi:MAG: N-6 DNA methylase [bacterium]
MPDGCIAIYREIANARKIGAYDTPREIVKFIVRETLLPLCEKETPPKVLDPACGAGYFLIEALDLLAEYYPVYGIERLVFDCLYGIDIDPIGERLTSVNLSFHLREKDLLDLKPEQFRENIINADSLSKFGSGFPLERAGFDCVIGNPPYQFLSGRGSPVASLVKSGQIEKANELRYLVNEYMNRFRRSSQGCRDYYKWFIERGIEFLKPDGRMGYITPNTWLFYPRYRDIRILFKESGQFETVIDLGSHAFDRAHVPASIFILTKTISKDNKFRLATRPYKIKNSSENEIDEFLRNYSDYTREAIIDNEADISFTRPVSHDSGNYENQILRLIDFRTAPHRTQLGNIVTLREGSHAIPAVGLDIPRIRTGENRFPVIIDKSFSQLKPPEIGFIKQPSKSTGASDFHEGERFFIRKTGDSLIIAPSGSHDFALAHQNVYVGKTKDPSVNMYTIIGILASSLLTDIYRLGPGGQHHRPHAQLRIKFLNRLPIIIIPNGNRKIPPVNEAEIVKFMSKIKVGNFDSLSIIPFDLPTDESKISETAFNIAMLHEIIARLTLEMVERQHDNMKDALDETVRRLYGIENKEVK